MCQGIIELCNVVVVRSGRMRGEAAKLYPQLISNCYVFTYSDHHLANCHRIELTTADYISFALSCSGSSLQPSHTTLTSLFLMFTANSRMWRIFSF